MKRKIELILLAITIIITGSVGITYALWTYNTSQVTNNILKSGCFKLEITDEQNNINLQNTIPLTNKEGMELTPYTFKVSNTCTTTASYEVNLESLVSSTLDSSFVRLSLNSKESKLLTEYELNSSTIISDAKEGRMLDSGVLKAGKSKSYSLRIWLDGNTTATSTVLDKTFNSKITVTGTLNPNYITVNLDPMGGKIAYTSVDEVIGTKYTGLPIPIKEGYYFDNWYLENTDNSITTNTIVTNAVSHTLKAKWLEASEIVLLKENAFESLTDYKTATTEIKPYTGELTDTIKNSASIISDETSLNKAYAWLDGTILYYAGDNNNIYMQNDVFGGYQTAFSNVTFIDLSPINTTLVTSLESFFEDCRALEILNLSNFNTYNVKTMKMAFWCCTSLSKLDLSNFETSNVENMWGLFRGCKNLNSIDLSSFNTSKVNNMNGILAGCDNLKDIDLSSFDTNNVLNMGSMFANNAKLENINISNLDTSNATDMSNMFGGCKSLTSLDLSNFDTSNVKSMLQMFTGCLALKSLNVSSFNTSKVTSMHDMFSNCISLEKIDVSNFDTSNVLYMFNMFSSCKSLTSLNVSNFNTSNVKYIDHMFDGCTSLTSLNLSSFNTNKATSYDNIIDENITEVILNCDNAATINDYISGNFPNTSISCI